MRALLSLLTLCCLAMPGWSEDYPVKNMLIEPGELLQLTGRPVVILDARSVGAYEAGHVVGAVRVDSNDWAKNFQDGKDQEGWAKRLSKLGLTPEVSVVIYDDASNKDAARIWWILKYWGLTDVRLLHGMWTGWKAANLPISTDIVVPKSTVFPLVAQGQRLATKKDVMESLAAKSAGIVDARTEAEHTGKTKLNNKYGGCMPGAKNLDWAQLVDAKTQRFKTPAEMSELFSKAKIDLSQPQIAHCQSGGRSSVMNFAMELMGAKNVRNYHASWGEWGNSDDVPIEGKK
jgi:thiosulfate/3-mercaptopyruvate sulfurtransferase